MSSQYIDIKTISDLHAFLDCAGPKHPLVSVINLKETQHRNQDEANIIYRLGFYAVYLKGLKGQMKYGKSHYDFDESTMVFTAPLQGVSAVREMQLDEGWGLFFHPDLLFKSELGRSIHHYNFFHYETSEALHISEDEKTVLRQCIENIEKEYSSRIDKHSNQLIVNNIELLLNYCMRFYDRQFYTRAKVSHDIVQKFEVLILAYFSQDTLLESGLPDVGYFASRLHLSPKYLSDLLSKYTGKTTQEHIHLKIINKAKHLLSSTNKTISEIAYDLGFEYPSYFTKLFKSHTNKTPNAFRNLN
jgi:AraC family transcriptional activator of pobA